jgi:hypothetical protein
LSIDQAVEARKKDPNGVPVIPPDKEAEYGG